VGRSKPVCLVLSFAISCSTAGCITSPGQRFSIWPTKKIDDPVSVGEAALPKASITEKVSSTARGVKGQFSTVSTVVSSAYGKAKTAVSSAFTTPPSTPPDATTLAGTTPNANTVGPEMSIIQGQMFEFNGQYAKAIDYYSKALEVEPNNLAALTSMARLHDRQNNSSKSIEFYQKAVTLAPNQAPLHAELADVQTRHGQVATAKEEYQKAINLDPKNRSYRSSMAGLLIDEGQAERALDELRQVDAPAMAQYQMAYLYMSRQNLSATKQYLTNALSLDPNLQPARDMMNSIAGPQTIQQASGLASQATQLYQNASQTFQQLSPNRSTAPSQPIITPATPIE
jgi:tetratricopeptide (TPR) repeat protein